MQGQNSSYATVFDLSPPSTEDEKIFKAARDRYFVAEHWPKYDEGDRYEDGPASLLYGAMMLMLILAALALGFAAGVLFQQMRGSA